MKSGAVIKWIVRERGEARVPHQVWIEGGVDDHRCAPLIARAAASGADDTVVVDADGNGLGVAEAVGGRVAPGAGIVIVQAGDGVEPEQPAYIGARRIQRPAETLFEPGFNVACKPELVKVVQQGLIERA